MEPLICNFPERKNITERKEKKKANAEMLLTIFARQRFRISILYLFAELLNFPLEAGIALQSLIQSGFWVVGAGELCNAPLQRLDVFLRSLADGSLRLSIIRAFSCQLGRGQSRNTSGAGSRC